MSTALLKFQRSEDARMAEQLSPSLDAAVLAAALEELPEAVAICEDNAVLYANRRFKEVCGTRATVAEGAASPLRWRKLDFEIKGRRLSLRTSAQSFDIPGSLQLALVGRMVAGVA